MENDGCGPEDVLSEVKRWPGRPGRIQDGPSDVKGKHGAKCQRSMKLLGRDITEGAGSREVQRGHPEGPLRSVSQNKLPDLASDLAESVTLMIPIGREVSEWVQRKPFPSVSIVKSSEPQRSSTESGGSDMCFIC